MPPVPADAPTILATSGGYRSADRHQLSFSPLVHHAVELSGATGRAPRVCHLGTAGGDQRWFNAELDDAARTAGFPPSPPKPFSLPSLRGVAGHPLEPDVVWGHGGGGARP